MFIKGVKKLLIILFISSEPSLPNLRNFSLNLVKPDMSAKVG